MQTPALAIDTINGLPAHPLLVHAVVVLIPLAALALVLSTLWPVARRRLGIVTPLLALVALVLVPITTEAGESLERSFPQSVPAIEKHAELGDQLLPWAVGLFVVALAHWLWTVRRNRAAASARTEPATGGGGVAVAERTQTTTRPNVVVDVVFAVLAVVVAVGSVWMLVRIGDSGAQAVWGGGS